MQPNAAAALRSRIRSGAFDLPTTGQAEGFLQANLVILPKLFASDFERYCHLNPKPCPIVAMGKPGDPTLQSAGDIDIRTDIARYRIYESGKHTRSVKDLRPVWRDDLVTFALGCSFSFECALHDAGIDVRHISAGRNVPMYVTNIQTVQAGIFSGPMVVSMRAFRPSDLIRAIVISNEMPIAHGAPVHIGDPASIGIADIGKPDFGDPPVIGEGDMLGFWACGVTPQMALREAGIDFAITHEPGYMLVTDLPAVRRG